MDDRLFDDLSRRVGARSPARLPRRAVTAALGVTALAAAIDPWLDRDDASAKKKGKKCKDDGKKCSKSGDCCGSLKCNDGRCGEKGGNCPTKVDFDFAWSTFNATSGPNSFSQPWGIASDNDGLLYVTDTNNERVLIFNQNGNLSGQFGSEGSENDEFEEPFGIGVNRNNDGNKRVIVADPGQSNTDRKVRQFRSTGQFEGELGVSNLNDPRGVGIDDDDRIWVLDRSGSQIFRYGPNGGTNPIVFEPSGSGQLSSPEGIALFRDNDNDLYLFVADTGNNRVVKFRHDGDSSDGLQFIDEAGSGGGGSKSFNQPTGITVDKCGNLYVADRLNNRIQQLDKDLDFKSSITSGLNRPTGVAIPEDSNLLFIVDRDNNRVVVLDLVK